MAAEDKKDEQPSIDSFFDQKNMNTIRGIEKESDVASYPVGFVFNAWEKEYSAAKYFGDERYPELLAKYKIVEYFFSTIVHVCRGDGVLGDKEKLFVLRYCKEWGMTDQKEIDEVLKGKDYGKEYIDGCKTISDELHGKGTQKSKQLEKLSKISMIYWSVSASCQDGLVRDEINEVYKLAEQYNITKQTVKDIVQILRYEQAIAKKMQEFEKV